MFASITPALAFGGAAERTPVKLFNNHLLKLTRLLQYFIKLTRF
jgi:hypothetical protein